MTSKEINKYLAYAPENIDLVVLRRDEYDRLMKKAFFFDKLKKKFQKMLDKG